MKYIFSFILKYYLFWLLLFQGGRILFIFIQSLNGSHVTVKDGLTALVYGLRMDISMTAYFMVPMFLALFFNGLFRSSSVNTFIRFYSYFIIILVCLILAIDCELYQDWGFRMDYTPFLYLQQANEARHFLSLKMIIVFFLSFTLMLFLAVFLYRHLFSNKNYELSNKWPLLYLLLLASLIIPMRGGIAQVPLNTGHMYFSPNLFSNHVAINPLWNIFYSYRQRKKIASTTHFMDQSKADSLVSEVYPQKEDSTVSILNTNRPDVVIMIIESFTSNMLNKTVDGKEITPNLNKIIKNGVFFENAYGSGERTDKGVVCVLSAYPAQPQSSIMMYQSKCDKLPSLAKELNQAGYHASFYYGGDLGLASMKSYLIGAGFTKIIDKYYFPSETYNAKWGVHDHILLQKAYDDIMEEKSPFFTSILTLSSHPPYDVPAENVWENTNEERQFINSAHYTDKSIGTFVDKLKQSDRWKNLLLILVADHGGRFPGNMEYHLNEKFKISFHWTGGAVMKDTIIKTLSLQSDISKSLLGQMDLDASSFRFSQNLFSKTKNPFVYYAFNNGVGWIDEGGLSVFSNDSKNFILKKGNPLTSEETIKAYLQTLMDDFEKR